ncbi:MAG: hypothetical protein HOF01_08515 [Chloroflexi bacterium]|jgi:hypothetical protein|nr:hypothetical protein [Chloroflexota bacterium]
MFPITLRSCWQRDDPDAQQMAATLQGEILKKVLLAITILALVSAACSEPDPGAIPSIIPESVNMFSNKNTYVMHRANGYFTGQGQMPRNQTNYEFAITARTGSSFRWIDANVSSVADTAWGLEREDRTWLTFRMNAGEISRLGSSSPLHEHLLRPTLVEEEDGHLALSVNAVSNPVNLELAAALSKVENTPDGSTVESSDARLYSYTGATDQYPHGALGDKTEWSQLVAFSIVPEADDSRFSLAVGEVFEGLFPMAADLNGDGVDEIITTVSNSDAGARLVVFGHDEDGLNIVAESDPVGTGFRWLHQIAVAPVGPNGEIEIAVVETPHVGGIAKFYRLDGDRLELVASKAGGYMSHVNGSRNLDQAVAGDFDGDGAVELIVPSRDQKSLIALRRIGDSVEEVWELELDSRISTNLAVVETNDGGLALGVGTEDGILHIWQ